MEKEGRNKLILSICAIIIVTSLILSGINNAYPKGWILESCFIIFSIFLFILIDKKIKFSSLSYIFLTFFIVLHAIGSHYMYSDVLPGIWLKSLFNLTRNPYDRLMHLVFGLLFYLPAFEFYRKISNSAHQKSKAASTFIIPIFIVISFGGIFEILEWIIATISPTTYGLVYLAYQGDFWDCQKDMLFQTLGCLISAFIAYLKK